MAALAAVGGAGGLALDRVRQVRIAARRAIGLPAPMSPAPPLPAGVQVEGVSPFTTPLDTFYRVDISLVTPRIDASSWSLQIDGMVDNPLTLTYDELLALPLIERDITLTCVSNEVGGPYVSTGRWLGVPFAEIIRRVGVRPGVDQVYSYSSDSGYTCSTPYAAVSDGRDAMVVVGLNGEVLPDPRGFPARMLVPGLFGFVSATKWLERIEFTTYAERSAYWTDRDWATDAPILTQSRIELPKSLATLPKAKPVIAGVAWAQHRGIAKVEIRIDEGDWQEATLADDGGIDLWRQWSFRYDGPRRPAQRPGPGHRPGPARPARAADQGLPARRDRLAPDPVHRRVDPPALFGSPPPLHAREFPTTAVLRTEPKASALRRSWRDPTLPRRERWERTCTFVPRRCRSRLREASASSAWRRPRASSSPPPAGAAARPAWPAAPRRPGS